MRRIIVTGANKGIGFAIAERVLEEADDTFVFLGSRDRGRGEAAAAKLRQDVPGYDQRIEVVEIDVARDESVRRAAEQVREAVGGEALYGIVNNAGTGIGSGDLAQVLDVNTRGLHRVCTAMIPLLREGGRIVNVTSAAGPSFVSACSPDRQRFFTRPDVSWREIDALMKECVEIAGDEEAFSSRGLSDGSPYGLSKACANVYTTSLAREHPGLVINACTPGFIATDMTRQYEQGRGQSLAAMGAKTPREGASCPLFLLLGEPESSGHYYGSDAKRSPLDRYRAPGSPPYTGS